MINRNSILWLFKVIILFVFLLVIVKIGKELKSVEEVNPQVKINPMYEESLAEVNQMQKDIELQIRLENEHRALEYKNAR